jgi:hypothetical protein
MQELLRHLQKQTYMCHSLLYMFIMFCEYMSSYCLFLFIILFSASRMFELHMVVFGFGMLYILKLIMESVPNYPKKIMNLLNILEKFHVFVLEF